MLGRLVAAKWIEAQSEHPDEIGAVYGITLHSDPQRAEELIAAGITPVLSAEVCVPASVPGERCAILGREQIPS